MTAKYTIFLSLLLIAACKQKSNSYTVNPAAPSLDTMVKTIPIDTTNGYGPAWASDLVWKYITECNSENMRAAREDSPIAWIFDHLNKNDTATYYVYHIGIDRKDRFATVGWVYIDSASKAIYEYNIVEDSISLWRK